MRHGHARWHGQPVVLALCLGSKNVWVAYGHQLLKVSQEQLRMAPITERVADDVIHQEPRAIGENSAAEGQVLPKYFGYLQRSTTTVSRRVHPGKSGRESRTT